MSNATWHQALSRRLRQRRKRHRRGRSLGLFNKPLRFESLEQRWLLAAFTVDTELDEDDLNPGNGTIETDSGFVSLRAAITEANALAGDDTINFAAGLEPILLGGTELLITTNITITGNGADETIINGNGESRVFYIDNGATVEISGVTIRNGSTGSCGGNFDSGGGIRNEGDLTLSNSIVTGNTTSGDGGGIYNHAADGTTATLTINSSTIGGVGDGEGNVACDSGGGVANYAYYDSTATVTINNSTIAGNYAYTDGGGVSNYAHGYYSVAEATANLTVKNSTISGNTAGENGGGISNGSYWYYCCYESEEPPYYSYSYGDRAYLLTFNSTISGNDAISGTGGGIHNDFRDDEETSCGYYCGFGTIDELHSTIIAGNTAESGGDDLFDAGELNSATFNLIGSDGGHSIPDGGPDKNLVGTDEFPLDPLLGPLQDNGGPTFTHALLEDSPAIDAGTNPCSLVTDQRGQPRTVDMLEINADDGTDIGAFELSLDFGDAPDPTYATLLVNDGPRHMLGTGLFLGASVDPEPDGQPNATATGDDIDAAFSGPFDTAFPPGDEDGVTDATAFVVGQSASITVDASAPGLLDAWIDLDGNGTFDHPAEHLNGGVSIAVVAGPNVLNFAVPINAAIGTTYARLRLSSVGGLLPTGVVSTEAGDMWPDGEVEDYEIEIESALVIDEGAPGFSKFFSPSTIGPGSTSTLTFTIDNGEPTPLTDLAFIDALPTGITLAAPSSASTNCADGILSAPDGGSTISLTDARLGADQACSVTVNVVGSMTATNTSGNLTSSAGNSGPAEATLTVDSSLPGFSKSFSPSTVSLGGRSTLTFTIDNTDNALAVENLDFTDTLPVGMEIASPSNASTTCGTATIPPTLIAASGTTSIVLDANGTAGFPAVGAESSCTVTVDVIATGAGQLDNISGDLLADFVSSGKASATLESTVTTIALDKDFINDPVPPGGDVTVNFVITNRDRNDSATGIAFTDDLAAGLTGLTFDSLLSNDCGGTVSGVGTTDLDLTGGSLAAGASCTISASLSVPISAVPGVYTNTTGAITGTLGGSPVVGNVASDNLFVASIPLLTKEFLDSQTLASDPVINAGDDVVIRFTVTNSSPTSMATDVTFLDELTDGSGDFPPDLTSGFLPFPVDVTLPPVPNPPCGAGSSLALVSAGTDRQALELTGGSLAAGATCSFDVTVTVPEGFAPGIYTNTTEEVTATVDGATRTGLPASDTLTVIAAPSLTKAFTDDPVAPGGTVTLEFTLELSPNSPTPATDITFTDDLASLVPSLPGLTATGLPLTAACDPDGPDPAPATGTLSGSAGDTLLTFMGGTLMPGESCTFSVTLAVPAGAAAGSYANTTSGVSATVSGVTATSAAAEDDLDVAGLVFSKEFLKNPVIAGDTTTLRFTIDNVHPTEDATITFFTDNLDAALDDLAATGSPSLDTCGGSLSGTTFLVYTGGSVLSGESCTIEVDVLVPSAAVDDIYSNLTSSLSANQGGAVTIKPAFNTLEVDSTVLRITKEFTDDPVAPGGTVTLEFNLSNVSTTETVGDIAFSDDLHAALTGLIATGATMNTCGGGAVGMPSAFPTSFFDYVGGSLAAGASCTISLVVDVPVEAAPGTFPNTTSNVTGLTSGELPVTGEPAIDELKIAGPVTFSKSFDGPTTATGTPVLTFTIMNSSSEPAARLGFSDNLDAVISGLVATNLPLSNVCGAGSLLSGTSSLVLTGGELGPMSSCTFDVELLVPETASPGTFLNTTSSLSSSGIPVAFPASDTLLVVGPPEFSKSFAPDTVLLNGTSTLMFTIDNLANAVPASGLDFTDNLPEGIIIAATPNALTTCAGGVLTAAAGSQVVDYTGGSVAANASCTVQVDITGVRVGSQVNTSDELTSSLGNSGSASDMLKVIPLTFGKSFLPDVIGVGSTSTLTFEIVNLGSNPVAGLSFTDNLPTGVTIAAPTNASSSCGGTFDAQDGGSTIELTAGGLGGTSSCSVAVDVTSSVPGTHTNETSELQYSGGTIDPATADLIVSTDIPGFTKSFSPDSINRGSRSTLTFTIDFSGNEGGPATDLAFTDNLPLGIVIAAPTNALTTCTGGVLTAVAGTDLISYSEGSVGAMASCTISVDVIGTAVGLLGNTTSELTSGINIEGPSEGTVSSGKASAVLTVTGARIALVKSFTDDPVLPGGTVTTQFVISNFDRNTSATNITFTDDLDATLSGLVRTGAALANICGTGSSLSGTSLLTFSGGTLAAGASCTFNVTLQVPAAAATGVYTNTTSSITAKFGTQTVTGSPATDNLFVQTLPVLTKSFTNDPVGGGGNVNLNFNIRNTNTTFAATSIAFTDTLLSGLTVASLPAAGFCGTGSTLVLSTVGALPTLIMTGGNLPAGGSCSFEVTLLVAAGAAGGTFTNTTSEITAEINEQPVTGKPASDDLVIVRGPRLRKEFTDDPVLPGETATLQFTLTNSAEGASTATNISFTDDLSAVLAGLAAVAPLDTGTCNGALTGTSTLIYSGGSLAAGASCDFNVVVLVPLAALPGTYTNETSNVTATVQGVTTQGTVASDDLLVAGLSISKEFTNDPVPAGGTVTLQFVINNESAVADATNITFTDDLDGTLLGLVATGTPLSNVCGTGSLLTGTSVLELTGGNLAAGESCSFSVTLQVPTAAASDVYPNTTSNLTALFDETPVTLAPATDALIVASDLLLLDKDFVQSSAFPGDTVTLDFTVTNLDASQTVTNITFTDDLSAALAGLVAVGLPADNVCGAGSQLTGGSLLTLTGATLGPGASCSFSATVQLPPDIPFGTVVTNTTSQATGDLGGLQVTSDPASDDLRIDFFQFSKSFDGLTYAGGTPKLTFTIENPAETNISDISFSDNLSAVIPGLTAIGLPTSGVCGAGSQLAGTSLLTLSGGNLGPGGSCTFTVTLQVPANAAPGTFTNVTSDLLLGGSPAASPAVDSLTVIPPPTFSKAFTPAGIPLTGTSTLSFSINNSASPLGATGLDFTDNLPAGVTVSAPPNALTTCTGGTLTAAAGSSAIALSGGAVAAGASCSVQVDITSSLSGSHLNVSGDLTSLLGNSGPASATLISQIMLMGGPLTPGVNILTTSQGLSDTIAILVQGTQLGSAQLTVQGVVITTAFADPVVKAFAETDEQGSASFVLFATAAQVGQTLHFQAFQILDVLDASEVLSVQVVDAPLLAEGGQAVLVHGESAEANTLTPAMLRSVTAKAIERWEAMGLTQAEIDLLHSTTVRIADLSGGVLGQLVGTTISIDYSAADYGWFVEETPGNGTEFGAILSQSESRANEGGPADQRMDLYTAVLHEFGHVLKFQDTSPTETIRGTMTAELPTSIRRLPNRWQNPSHILDVNGDGSVSPLDGLIIINEVNDSKFRDATGRLPTSVPGLAIRRFFDTNGDGFATALDVLRIFNHLNNFAITAIPEGEAPQHFVDLALLGLQAELPAVVTAVSRQAASRDRLDREDQSLVAPFFPSHTQEHDLQLSASKAMSADRDLALLEWLEQQSSDNATQF